MILSDECGMELLVWVIVFICSCGIGQGIDFCSSAVSVVEHFVILLACFMYSWSLYHNQVQVVSLFLFVIVNKDIVERWCM